MQIYRLKNLPNSRILRPVTDAGLARVGDINGVPVAATWQPLEVEVLSDGEFASSLDTDFVIILPGVLVMRNEARERLYDLLKPYGEFLPLICSSGSYCLFNATTRIDALDEEASEIKRLPSGRIIDVLTPAFVFEKVGDASIFRIRQLRNALYVADSVKSAVERNSLTGIAFLT